MFVDARAVEGYASGHIAGALSIPLSNLSTSLSQLDPNAWSIAYCT